MTAAGVVAAATYGWAVSKSVTNQLRMSIVWEEVAKAAIDFDGKQPRLETRLMCGGQD